MTQGDLSARDGDVAKSFYSVLKFKADRPRDVYARYYRDVHGGVQARLPGAWQWWQHHLERDDPRWPAPDGVARPRTPAEQVDAIGEATFRSEDDLARLGAAVAPLIEDEPNLFREAVPYLCAEGDAATPVDRIANPAPSGSDIGTRFHLLVRRAAGVGTADLRAFVRGLAAGWATSPDVLKVRLHLLAEVTEDAVPEVPGVVHVPPRDEQFDAGVEIAFGDDAALRRFLDSPAFAATLDGQAAHFGYLAAFPVAAVHTYVLGGEPTLAGQRGFEVARLVDEVGAANQRRLTELFFKPVPVGEAPHAPAAGAAERAPEAVEVVRRWYAMVEAGTANTEGYKTTTAPGVSWGIAEGYPHGGTYVGHDAIWGDFYVRLNRDVEIGAELHEIRDAGGGVVVSLGTYHGRAKATGETFSTPYANFWTVRDGRIVALRQFTDTMAFQEALGSKRAVPPK